MRKRVIHNEFEMMEGFRQGLEKSFSEVFNQLYPALTSYSLRITGDQSASEDIGEESFIKIWDKRGSFFRFEVLKSYLYTTVRNDSFKWLKKNNQLLTIKTEIATNVSNSEINALEGIIRVEVFREIHTVLDSLPNQSRKIMKMIFFEDKNTREIANELGLSIGTVKTQKARGLV